MFMKVLAGNKDWAIEGMARGCMKRALCYGENLNFGGA